MEFFTELHNRVDEIQTTQELCQILKQQIFINNHPVLVNLFDRFSIRRELNELDRKYILTICRNEIDKMNICKSQIEDLSPGTIIYDADKGIDLLSREKKVDNEISFAVRFFNQQMANHASREELIDALKELNQTLLSPLIGKLIEQHLRNDDSYLTPGERIQIHTMIERIVSKKMVQKKNVINDPFVDLCRNIINNLKLLTVEGLENMFSSINSFDLDVRTFHMETIKDIITKLSEFKQEGNSILTTYQSCQILEILESVVPDAYIKFITEETLITPDPFIDLCYQGLEKLIQSTKAELVMLFKQMDAFDSKIKHKHQHSIQAIKTKFSEFKRDQSPDRRLTPRQHDRLKELLERIVANPNPAVVETDIEKVNQPITVQPKLIKIQDATAVMVVNSLIEELERVTMSSHISQALLNFENFVIGVNVDYIGFTGLIKPAVDYLSESGWHFKFNEADEGPHGFLTAPTKIDGVIKILSEMIGRTYIYKNIDTLIGVKEFYHELNEKEFSRHIVSDAIMEINESNNMEINDDTDFSMSTFLSILIENLKKGENVTSSIKEFIDSVNDLTESTEEIQLIVDCLTAYGWNGKIFDGDREKLIYALEHF